MSVRNRAAIIGVGETEFSRNAGRSNLRLALEAITAALDDAGLSPRDVDAIVKMHANTDLFEIDIMRSLGIPNLRFFSEIPHGGGGSVGTVVHAAAAIAAGQADVVVCLPLDPALAAAGRTLAGGSLRRGRDAVPHPGRPRHAGAVGGDVRPALPPRLQPHYRGVRPLRRADPQQRRDQPARDAIRPHRDP